MGQSGIEYSDESSGIAQVRRRWRCMWTRCCMVHQPTGVCCCTGSAEFGAEKRTSTILSNTVWQAAQNAGIEKNVYYYIIGIPNVYSAVSIIRHYTPALMSTGHMLINEDAGEAVKYSTLSTSYRPICAHLNLRVSYHSLSSLSVLVHVNRRFQ